MLYHFERPARSTKSVVVLLGMIGLLAILILVFQASWIILSFGVVITLPLLWDIVANPVAQFTLDEKTISWTMGRKIVAVERRDIDRIRFDTRLDGSRKITLFLNYGGKRVVAPPCTPPIKDIERVLKAAGITYEIRHFHLL
jgi:hypothetical protein